MNAIIELDVLGIIARAGPGRQLMSSEIAVSLPGVKDPKTTASMLERMLWLLATYNVVSCTVVEDKDGGVKKRFGLAAVAKYFVPDNDGVSLAPLMRLSQDKVFVDSW
ncbi:caffeic acid 3-O-methyltransferase-like [Chenopodium quinoa]|uniref:caffeic acid 3-O-methyltransferase-like n=1 Tax=Chenopodium quinoa TaxID=63459 RepID=UPI000B774498|nr:caffeic acid 3-O-methyltransferase-like [Chenopodium quinoa]